MNAFYLSRENRLEIKLINNDTLNSVDLLGSIDVSFQRRLL